ncbi:ESPR-type extended signal peptide-containing protein [Stenotrophomonas hibiscicola]|uniref:ESPR-type extended signal peptide-containing protein n=1 Tax=Stenotrophomonas hibiscicola TaxID=86189 RepID=UPI002E798F5E|nr:ESPR-type extended signal peptide-containing protein [[Pseudomonas] hibiscicola]
MNKIYRRLWSTARQCWVVASELTSPRGKASQTVGAGLIAVSLMTGSAAALAEEQAEDDAAVFEDSQLLWAMQAAFGARGMSASTTAPSSVGTLNTVYQQVALTTDNAYRNSTVSGNHLVILGSRSSLSGNQSVAYGNLITSRGDSNTAIGHGVQITGGGYATGVGAAAVANGIGATALGHDAKANTQNSIAVGSGSRTDSGAGISKIAIGGNAYAGTGGWTGAIALGGAARAEYDSVAIGYEAKTSATMSVALGRGSIATESNTVSVGSAGKERRIVNVKDGTINGASTDAVNGRQLSSARDLAQRGVNDAATAQRVATGAKSTADQALANTKLVTQTSASSGIRIGGDNTGNVLTVSNKNGDLRYLNGVRNGTLSATSTDAVNGQQLFATNQRLDTAGRNTATGNVITEANKATATGNLSLAMGQVAKANGVAAMALGHGAVAEAGNAVAIGSASGASGAFAVAVGGNAKATHENSVALGEKSVTTGAKQVSVGNATMKRKIINVDDGAINASSSEAVTGKQMYLESQRVNGLVKQASAGGIMYLGAENTGNVLTVSNKDGGKRYVNGVQNAALSASSSDAVTGQQLFATNNNVTTAQNTANNALGRANALGGLVSQAAADGNVRLGGENTGAVLDVRNKANANRTLSGLKDGAVNGTSTEAVTGKQLNTTNTEVASVRTVATAAQTTANTAKTTADSALGKANTLGGLVSQVAADGSVRIGGENAGAVLDVRNKSNTNRTLSGLKDGAVNGTSTEAVTGKQLNTTITEVASVRTVATAAQTTANTAKTTADIALGKANTLGGLVSQVAADGNVRLGGENTGAMLDVRNKSGGVRSLSGLADGTISATSTEAVTGKQLQATHDRLATAQSRADAAHAGATAAQTTANQAKVKADATGNAVATSGVIEDRNRATATGNLAMAMGQAAKANGVAAFAMGHSAVASGNNAVSVGSASAASATSAVALGGNAKAKHENSVALGERSETSGNDEVSVGNAATDLKRRIVNVDDARLTDSSTDAVTGMQLFATNEKVEANEGVLAGHTIDLAAQSGRIADNRRDLDALRSEFEDFDPDLDGVVKFAADGSVDIAGGKLRGVAAGDISSSASTDAVNGGQLFATNERISSMEYGGRFFKVGTDEYSEDAYAGWFGVAIGESAEASRMGEGGVAVGGYARALATNSVALGRGSTVMQDATKGFALGAGSRVDAEGGVAFGADSKVMSAARGSVAIGEGSIADVAGTVSLGGEGLVRRITNVGRGLGLSDASTVAQLDDALRTLGAGAGMDGNGNIIAPTYNVQGGTQNNVGDALAALDSAVVTADSRVDNLEGKLRSAFQYGPSVRADGLNQLVLAGANGSVLTNLADGRIAAGSRDAVTGSQLFEAKQEIARNRSDLNDLRGQRDGLLSRGLMVAEQGNVIDFGGARLTGVADGVISADSRDVVNGRQLHSRDARISSIEKQSRYVSVWSDQHSQAARAGLMGVAIGDGAFSAPEAEGGTAVGSYSSAQARNSVALGRGANVGRSGEQGFAAMVGSNVYARDGIAVGAYSRVEEGAFGSLALGSSSIADGSNVLSVGHVNLQRRIVNVANGRNATDAATVGQLRGALATLGGDVDANGNIVNPTFNVQGAQQSTLNDALSSLDSAVVTTTARTERVENQLRAVFQDSPSVRNDGLNQLTFAGANGMVLSNVANGAIAAGSRDAVNGGQLHSMQQQLNGRMDGLEQRIDGQPQAPQSRSLTVAAAGGSTASSTPAATPAADEPTAPPPSTGDNKVVADAGNAPKSSPQPQADAPKPESPTPQVDTAELEKMLARANEYSDGISREVDRRLDKMDKRFNRMAAMTSAQSAMAMNTAGLNTYNRLGAGVGYSEGESAMAVGYQRVLNDKGSATFSLNGAFTNSGERSMGVGVGIGW